MDKRLLRWLTIIIPVGFLVIFFLTLNLALGEDIQVIQLVIIFVTFTVGALIFSNWVFSIIDQREKQMNQYAAQLEALNRASLLITTELEMAMVLQKVVDISRELVASEYGALGIFNDSGIYYEQFIPSGGEDFSANFGVKLGEYILEALDNIGEAFRNNDLVSDKGIKDFIEKYPKLYTALGVPIISKGEVIGNLFLANKNDQEEYSEEDQQVLEMFANQTAIVIENAKLYRQTRRLAVLQERERFGMDLHDGVIQSIYAVGLMLEDIRGRVSKEPEKSRQGIATAVVSLNNAISDLRNYILNLRPHHFQDRNLLEGVEELARALRANTFMNVYVEMCKLDSSLLSAEDTSELLHITQEALSNVQKHARATDVEVRANIENKHLIFEILDNGISIPTEMVMHSTGNGLNNMRERTETLDGKIEIKQQETGGTVIRLEIPLKYSEKPKL
jgi:signal transduction histidine kinase